MSAVPPSVELFPSGPRVTYESERAFEYAQGHWYTLPPQFVLLGKGARVLALAEHGYVRTWRQPGWQADQPQSLIGYAVYAAQAEGQKLPTKYEWVVLVNGPVLRASYEIYVARLPDLLNLLQLHLQPLASRQLTLGESHE